MPKPPRFCQNHPDKRAHGHGLCDNCYYRHLRDRNPEYIERQKQRHRDWHERNKPAEQQRWQRYHKINAEHLKQQQRDYYARLTPEERWARNIRATYGLTAAQYYALLKQQDGCCAICKHQPRPTEKLKVDHLHQYKDGKLLRGRRWKQYVRGLLCGRCNSLVGWVEKHNSHVGAALLYLERGR